MTTDLDRRNFLFRSGATLGGLLASPRLGMLAAVGGAIAASEEASSSASQAKFQAQEERLLLRSGEPINTRGQPFGQQVTAAVTLAAPTAKQGERLFFVAGHGSSKSFVEDAAQDATAERLRLRGTGISIVEFQFDPQKKTWRHIVGSLHNRRWDGETAIPLEGARLGSDGKLFREQSLLAGTGEISAMVALPWQTVLAAEREGWLVEVNPATGLAVKRFSLGRLGAISLAVDARPGEPIAIYALGSRCLFKFVSHQRFDARLVQANASVLMIGELFAADFAQSRWVPLTRGLSMEEWSELLPRVAEAGNPPAPLETLSVLENPRALAIQAQSLVINTATETIAIQDLGETFTPTRRASCSPTTQPGAPELRLGHFTIRHDRSSPANPSALVFASRLVSQNDTAAPAPTPACT